MGIIKQEFTGRNKKNNFNKLFNKLKIVRNKKERIRTYFEEEE